MPVFFYKAKKSSAETVTGQIKAHNEDEAVELIYQLGLTPISVGLQKGERTRRLKGKVSSKEIYVFSRQLANLLKSGLSLFRSLIIIEDQTQNFYLKDIIAVIAEDVKNGKSFSDCLLAHPKIFSSLYVTMVRAGEESGNLQETLLNIASYQKKQQEMFSKIRSALAYPMFMAGMGIVTVYFILTFVAPKMAGLFKDMKDLPLPTVILLRISSFMSYHWIFFVIGLLILVLLFRVLRANQNIKNFFSGFLLRVPILGQIVLKAELGRFCRAVVLLLKSGVSLIRALDISIPILSNDLIKNQLKTCQEDLKSGGSFGSSIKKFKEIPSMMGHLIVVGEESGNLNGILAEIADTYEQEIDENIKTFTNLLEPLMILVVGLLVGFIVFAMLLPIFQFDALAR